MNWPELTTSQSIVMMALERQLDYPGEYQDLFYVVWGSRSYVDILWLKTFQDLVIIPLRHKRLIRCVNREKRYYKLTRHAIITGFLTSLE